MLINPYRFSRLWTPADITTALWLDAADASTVTESSGLISQVNDKSGNGRNFTASGGVRPTYTGNTVNGLSVFTFGGAQWLTSASAASVWTFLHDSTGSSVFVLWRPGNSSDPNAFYGCIGTNGILSANRGMALWYDDRASVSRDNRLGTFVTDNTANWVILATTPNNFVAPNQYQVCGWVLNPSAAASSRSSVRVNGGTASQTNTETTTFTTLSPTFIAQIGAAGNNAAPLIGAIAEIVIISGVISDANRQRVEGYMAWRWGLSSGLPTDHPYKSAAPTI